MKRFIFVLMFMLCWSHNSFSENVKSGTGALAAITTGDENTAIGGYTLRSLTTGHGNTALGAYAGRSALTVNGGIYLGYGAGVSNTSAHKLFIQTMFYPSYGIFGDFSTGYFGINTTSPTYNWEITGTSYTSGLATFAGGMSLSDQFVISDSLFVSKEKTVVGADSSLVITVASGQPIVDFNSASGNDVNITMTSADVMKFQGASAGYTFDDGVLVSSGGGNLAVVPSPLSNESDSALVISISSGQPTITFAAADNGTSTIASANNDVLAFAGASNGYTLDQFVTVSAAQNANTYVIATNTDSTTTAATANVKASAQWGGMSMIAHGKGRTDVRYGHRIGNWGTLENDAISTVHGSHGLIIGTRCAKPIIFGINDSFAAVIDSLENVGIGSEVPTGKLTVRGIVGGNDSLLVLRASTGNTVASVDTLGNFNNKNNISAGNNISGVKVTGSGAGNFASLVTSGNITAGNDVNIGGAANVTGRLSGAMINDQNAYDLAGRIQSYNYITHMMFNWITPATTEQDLSSANHDATYNNFATSDVIPYGRTWFLSFYDGKNENLTLADHADFTTIDGGAGNNLTIMVWVNIVASDSVQTIFCKWDETNGAETREWKLTLTAAEKLA